MDTRKAYSGLPEKEMIGRVYNIDVKLINTSQQVVRPDGLFAFMFTNLGDTICRVNDMVIFPSATPATALGDSRSISAHLMDLYKGNINVSFANPGGASPLIEMVLLFYTESQAVLPGRNLG